MRLRACIFCAEYNFGRDFGNVRFIAFMLQVGVRGSSPAQRRVILIFWPMRLIG